MTLNLQRIAWAVMIGAFFMFCGLCAFTVYGTYAFLFQSTVPLVAVAQASSGSIGITGADLREDVERGARVLAIGNLVRPNDQNSQGVIVLLDPYRDDAVVASISLIGDSSVSLRSALRPRFDWGQSGYTVDIGRATGTFEVTIAQDLPRGLRFDLITEQRARVRLSEPGWYEVTVRDDIISVTSHGGTALIYGPDKTVGYSVTSGSGSAYSISTDVIRAQPQVVNLLQNSQLATLPESDDGSLDSSVPLDWRCSTSTEASAPRGFFTPETHDGRHVLRMTRLNTDKPGETGCYQGLALGERWIDISGYTSLSIRAALVIESHSLPVCGFEGSECPLMLRLDYLVAGDQPGEFRRGELLYGFYAVPGPVDPFDQTCASCIQPHVRILDKAWYVFDSGNLLVGFPPDRRPVAISRLTFYASGHSYDVRLSRIELIAAGPTG